MLTPSLLTPALCPSDEPSIESDPAQPTLAAPPQALLSLLRQVKDFRSHRTRDHPLTDILTSAILATLCGADSWTDRETFGNSKHEWLKQFLALPNGIPSHDTFRRVFLLLKPQAWQALFQEWAQTMRERLRAAAATDALAPPTPEAINIDGKVARGTRPQGGCLTAGLRQVSAWSESCRLVLGEVATAEKSNEITAIPLLLKMLEIAGCVITIDAMGCQKKIAQQIVAQGGDYVLSLKGNQGKLHEEVQASLGEVVESQSAPAGGDYAETAEVGHGRREVRRCWTLKELSGLGQASKWSGLQSIVCVETEREVLGSNYLSIERRYFISSLSGSAEELLKYVRGHWAIENGLHWCLDVGFREDANRSQAGHSAENLGLVRHFTLNLLKQDRRSGIGLAAKRKKAGWDEKYLLELLEILDA